jgi:hypothetical protein
MVELHLIVSLSFDIFALLTVLQDNNLVNRHVLPLRLSRIAPPGKSSRATKKFIESRSHARRIRAGGVGPRILQQR